MGSSELAEGLMLFRAGTLKMIRFQLAMEQRDRRVALQAVDDLVALDRQLQDYLAQMPATPVPGTLMDELEVERATLNREKLTLAAGVIRREVRVPDPEPQAESVTWSTRDYALADQQRRRRGLRWLAAFVILVSALATTAFVPGVPERVQALAAQAGALR